MVELEELTVIPMDWVKPLCNWKGYELKSTFDLRCVNKW